MILQRIKVTIKSLIPTLSLLMLWLYLGLMELSAQCAMCKGQLETHGDDSTSLAVNHGILYLLAMPFILVGLVGFVVYRKSKKLREEEQLEAEVF